MHPVTILVVDIGTDEAQIPRMCERLNKVQSVFKFEVHSVGIPLDDTASARPPYYDVDKLLLAIDELRTAGLGMNLAIGITPVPLASRFERSLMARLGVDCQQRLEWDEDYFGAWRSLDPSTPDAPPRCAVISTFLWRRRFERDAHRTLDQYLESMVLAFLGSALYEKSLTHYQFRGCIFDYNADLESFVDSLRAARFCRNCTDALKAGPVVPIGVLPEDTKSVHQALAAILKEAGRVRIRMVLRVLQEDGTFSILVLGLIASLGINLLSSFFAQKSYETLVFVVAISIVCGWVVWTWLKPGPPLRR